MQLTNPMPPSSNLERALQPHPTSLQSNNFVNKRDRMECGPSRFLHTKLLLEKTNRWLSPGGISDRPGPFEIPAFQVSLHPLSTEWGTSNSIPCLQPHAPNFYPSHSKWYALIPFSPLFILVLAGKGQQNFPQWVLTLPLNLEMPFLWEAFLRLV